MLSQQFIFGYSMGWMALEELNHWMNNATFAPDMAFFATLARLRMTSAKYLVHGVAYRPVEIAPHGATTAIPLILICDFGDADSTGAPKCCNTSTVVASAWTNAAGDEIAIAVANHGVAPLTVELSLRLPAGYAGVGLIAWPMARRGVGDDSAPLSSSDSDIRVDRDNVARVTKLLAARSAEVLELKSRADYYK